MTASADIEIFMPSPRRRFWLFVLAGAGGLGLAIFFGSVLSHPRAAFPLLFFTPHLGLATGYFLLCASKRMTVGAGSVIRDWVLGRRLLSFAGTEGLSFYETRSGNLVLKMGRRKMMIFRFAFSGAQMREIRAAIENEAAKAGIAVEPDKPPFHILVSVAAGFVACTLLFGYFLFWLMERMLAAQ